jgi:hypothetical protein
VLSLGLNPEANRLCLHIDTIETLEEARQGQNLDQIDDEQTLWSMTEAVELAEIYHNLADYDLHTLRRKFKLILKGPGTPGCEDSDSNLARNTAFELSLAAKLRQTNVFRRLAENPDIICEANGTTVLVQCKRPLEEKGIIRNIERAAEQLRRDLQDPGNQNAKGVIAISLSRVLSPKLGLLRGTSTQAVRDVVAQEVDDIAQRNQGSCPRDGNIIGTVYDVSMPVFTVDAERPNGRLGSVHIQCTYRHDPRSSEDDRILRNMFAKPAV